MIKVWVVFLTILLSVPTFGQSHLAIEAERIPPPDTSISFRGIFSVSENEVWVSGTKGALYHSSDGGSRFNKMKIPNSEDSDFRDIECLPNGAILVMSVGSGESSKIFKSSDGRVTWRIVFENRHPNGFLNSIAFWDGDNGIAVGDPVHGRLYVLLTSDGGDTWQETDSKFIPEALENEHSFAASGTCVAVFGTNYAWVGMGGSAARILRTQDGGRTWHAHEAPILHGENSAGIFSLFFRDSNHGIAAGGDYTKEPLTTKTLAMTSNGGEQWTSLKDGVLPFQSSVDEISIAGTHYWLSTGPGGTHLSEDGFEWQALAADGYHCLSVSETGQAAWLAGSSGRVGRIHVQ